MSFSVCLHLKINICIEAISGVYMQLMVLLKKTSYVVAILYLLMPVVHHFKFLYPSTFSLWKKQGKDPEKITLKVWNYFVFVTCTSSSWPLGGAVSTVVAAAKQSAPETVYQENCSTCVTFSVSFLKFLLSLFCRSTEADIYPQSSPADPSHKRRISQRQDSRWQSEAMEGHYWMNQSRW